jgi:hypothetical protein
MGSNSCYSGNLREPGKYQLTGIALSLMQPYYQDESVTIFHAYCADVLRQLESNDHVITDPPYSAESHAMHEAGKYFARKLDRLDRPKLAFASIDGPRLSAILTNTRAKRWAVFTMDDRLTA